MNAAESDKDGKVSGVALLLQRGRRMNAAERQLGGIQILLALELQRGRRLNAAESGRIPVCRFFGMAASTGPPHERGGESET